MDTITEEFIWSSLKSLHKKNNKDFMGTGIIFYTDLSNLPFTSLNKNTDKAILENKNFIELIYRLSLKQSPYHDGFHFFNTNLMTLTHISQYLAPVIETNNTSALDAIRPCGAREMTAYLTSLTKGIVSVGLVSHMDGIKVYRNGNCIGES
ncbi:MULTISPECIES: hypothetical protein [Psychrobacter]|uniref:hypothetical protein n=2 Tax=Moraxellaceae TaxID=468 RepID=UPI000EE75822|nr:hypothetical protein [Psychrobacter sp.]HCH26216.1 hypothetical protein [Psychrobacter sp.]